MKKGIYINSIFKRNRKEFETSGVGKKIASQCKVLSKNFEMEHELHNYYKEQFTLKDKIKIRLPYTAIGEQWKYHNKYSRFDFIYFRKDNIDYTVYKFFKQIKRHNPACKIIFEIPTYPYDKEVCMSTKDIIFLLKDKWNRRRLRKYVDRVVTFSEDKEIWGIKTIPIYNGIDFSTISERKIKKDTSTIDVIAVANIAIWHGFDRFLEGMGQYYREGGKRSIVLHLVGDGMVVEDYKNIVDRYKIKEHVKFYGWKNAEELDEIYDSADIALDVLGGHRKNLFLSSSLKSRESGAKGLPIISSCKIDYLPEDYKYQLRVSQEDASIDMNDVIEFYDAVYSFESREQVAKNIREYAMTKCDINKTMQPVINYINEN